MDDNSVNVKEKIDIKSEILKVLRCINELKENYKLKDISSFITGKETALIRSHNLIESKLYGFGTNEGIIFWKSVIRKMIVEKLLFKNIESYGVLKISDIGLEFLTKPFTIMMSTDHDYSGDYKTETIKSEKVLTADTELLNICLLYTSPSPRD